MRFKNYILNEGRSKPIDKETVLEELKENCSQSVDRFKKGYKIYRAANNSDEFLKLVPSGKRQSAFAYKNYYTMILNNHKVWSKYPKREIICSGGSGGRAFWHGADNVYYVFPYDNAKIGICSADDIWDSFPKIKDVLKVFNLNEFNRLLAEMGFPDDNLNYYKKVTIGKWMNKFKEAGFMNLYGKLNNLIISKKFSKDDNIYEVFGKLMNPKDNGFSLQSIKNYSVPKSKDREVWTDSTCILIDTEMIETNKIEL